MALNMSTSLSPKRVGKNGSTIEHQMGKNYAANSRMPQVSHSMVTDPMRPKFKQKEYNNLFKESYRPDAAQNLISAQQQQMSH